MPQWAENLSIALLGHMWAHLKGCFLPPPSPDSWKGEAIFHRKESMFSKSLAGAHKKQICPLLDASHHARQTPRGILFYPHSPLRQALLPISDDQGPESGSSLPEVTQQVSARMANQFCLQIVGSARELPCSKAVSLSQSHRLPQQRGTVCHTDKTGEHLLLPSRDEKMGARRDLDTAATTSPPQLKGSEPVCFRRQKQCPQSPECEQSLHPAA